jgi:predicted nuclease of predicted toxin-antitoxin system
MLRFCADENFNNNILRGLLRRLSTLDIVRIQDVGLTGIDDISLLAWAAVEKRIVLTHDTKTMAGFAFARVDEGKPMPGVFVVDCDASPGFVLEDISLIVECSLNEEWEGQVIYLPFRL